MTTFDIVLRRVAMIMVIAVLVAVFAYLVEFAFFQGVFLHNLIDPPTLDPTY